MTDATQKSRKSSNPFMAIFTILGILMGTASLISLIQRWTGVEIISETARDALSIYRQMMEQIHLGLFDWWTPVELPWGWVFEMPMWGMDLLAIWAVSLASILRIHLHGGFRLDWLPANRVAAISVVAAFAPAVLLYSAWYFIESGVSFAIAWIRAAPIEITIKNSDGSLGDSLKHTGSEARRVNRIAALTSFEMVVGALAVPFCVVLFFLWNAIQITPQ